MKVQVLLLFSYVFMHLRCCSQCGGGAGGSGTSGMTDSKADVVSRETDRR